MLPKTDKSSRTTKSDSTSPLELQRVIQNESQSTDVTMSEVEVLDARDSPNWEETQLVDESHTILSDVTSSEV